VASGAHLLQEPLKAPVGGKVYGIPQEAQPFIMFANKTRLEEHGFSMPGFDWTVDELVAMARKLTRDTNQDGKVDLYGWQFDSSVTRFEPFLMAFGARMLSEDGSQSMLNSPLAARAFQFYHDAAVQFGVKGGSFQQGTAVFYSMGGPWMVPGFRKSISGWDWDILPAPGGPGGRGTTLGSDAMYISSTCKHPEAAWKFIKYLTSVEGLGLLSREGNVIASRQQVAVNYVNRKPSEPPYNLAAYLASIEIARPTQVFKRFINADVLFGQIAGQLWNNQISIPAALDSLATQINAMLK
jgi:multiple sugar transport system substrate-binding protein